MNDDFFTPILILYVADKYCPPLTAIVPSFTKVSADKPAAATATFLGLWQPEQTARCRYATSD